MRPHLAQPGLTFYPGSLQNFVAKKFDNVDDYNEYDKFDKYDYGNKYDKFDRYDRSGYGREDGARGEDEDGYTDPREYSDSEGDSSDEDDRIDRLIRYNPVKASRPFDDYNSEKRSKYSYENIDHTITADSVDGSSSRFRDYSRNPRKEIDDSYFGDNNEHLTGGADDLEEDRDIDEYINSIKRQAVEEYETRPAK